MNADTELFDSALTDAFAESTAAEGDTPAVVAPSAPEAPAVEPPPESPVTAPLVTEPQPEAAAGEPAIETPPEPPAEVPTPAAEPPQLAAPIDPAAFAAAVAAAVAASKSEPAAPAPVEDKPITIDQFLSEADKKLLGDYDKEWGEVARAEGIRRRAEMQVLQAETFREIGKVLAPIVHSLQQSQVATHFATIRGVHSDFDAVLPSVQTWVAKQPTLYRPALERVLASGTAPEVVELVSAYKQATGQTGAVPVIPASSVPQATAAGTVVPMVRAAQPSQKPGVAAAAAATAAVVSQRGNNQTASDPNDFIGALREALGG